MQIRHIPKHLLSAAAVVGFLGASGASLAAAGVAEAQAPDMPCPGNIAESLVIQGCLPSTSPPADELDLRGPDEVPKLYGIPCTGANTGTCIGLSRLPSADAPEPDTSVRNSQ
jgi:hypothetical protein